MTNTEKLAWLSDINAHLAAGGKLLANLAGVFKPTDSAPNWNSNPDCWRKVPLPCKATIRVWYWWDSDGLQSRIERTGVCVAGHAQVAEIEVTEQVK